MNTIGPQRVCGNCVFRVTSNSPNFLVKTFKCEKDMEWTSFDTVCNAHAFESETNPVEEKPAKKVRKSEVIDLGGIPASIKYSA